jgi:hypothetical protein
MLRELTEIFQATECDECQWVCQKYIERPQLVRGYKFDVRQWVLVADWNPLTVYVWRQPYCRFAGEKYDSSLADRNEYIHLVNNSIVKYMKGFDDVNEDLGVAGHMWFRQQYEEYLHHTYCPCKEHYTPVLTPPPYTCDTFGVRWEDVAFVGKEGDSDSEDEPDESLLDQVPVVPPVPPPEQATIDVVSSEDAKETATEAPAVSAVPAEATQEAGRVPCEDLWATCIAPQIEDIIYRSLMSVIDNVAHRKNTYELYGYDFMMSQPDPDPSKPDELPRPKVWLIEVNTSPAMDYSTAITTPLVKKCMEDTARIMVDQRDDPNVDTGEWVLMRHPSEGQAVCRPCNVGKLEVCGTKVEPPKKPLKTKKKKKKKKAKKAAEEEDDGADEGEDEGGDGENSDDAEGEVE